ncbi:helix-turn-helix transcriptional regulator [Rhodopseudomonas parapalustris]
MVNKEQVRAARAWLNLSQQELAEQARVSKRTLASFEQGASIPYDRTLRDVQAALEQLGIEFLFDGDIGVGIRALAKSD